MRHLLRISSLFALVSVGVFSDRFTKMIFEGTPNTPLIGDFLAIRGVYNTGVAFSFPIPSAILGVLTIGLVMAIAYYFVKKEFQKNAKMLDIGYALLFAGGLSNMYDRIMLGRVFDFIALKHFAIFNVADMMISVGVGLIICFHFAHDRTR